MKKTFHFIALSVIAALIASCSTKETKSYDPTKPIDMIEALSNDISSLSADWTKEDWDNAADNLEAAMKNLPDPLADDEATIVSSNLSRISVHANRHKRLATSLLDVISKYDNTDADDDADAESTIAEATSQQAESTSNLIETTAMAQAQPEAAPAPAQPVAAPAPPQPAVTPPSIPQARVPAGLLTGHVIREGGYTNVRRGPGTNYGIVQKIKDGSPIYYTDYNSSWCVVYDRAGNALGYMHTSKVIPDRAPAPVARNNPRGGVVWGTPYDWLSTRYATHNDLVYLDQGQLRVLRNSIYARHGRKFKDASLRQYFNSQPWYNGYRNEISARELNKYESYNINFIQKYE